MEKENNLFEIFIKTKDEERLSFFNGLEIEDKIKLYNWLIIAYPNILNDLISNMSPINISVLVEQFDEKTRLDFYKRLSNTQLQEYYNILPTKEEKLNLVNLVNNLKKDLVVENDHIANDIDKLNEKILVSSQNVLTNKQILKDNEKVLKSINKEIKRIERQERRALEKALKGYKPGNLDKIGIISSYKTKKLKEKINKYKEIHKNLEIKNDQKAIVEENIAKTKVELKKENANVRNYNHEIKKQSLMIRNNLVTIKNISALEKKTLGMQLYKKIYNINDKVMERPRKNNNLNNSVSEEQKSNDKTPVMNNPEKKNEINSTDLVNQLMASMRVLNSLGVTFNFEGSVSNISNANLGSPVASVSPKEMVAINEALKVYGSYLNENPRSKARGFVNFTLVVIITLIIIIGSLFIGAFLI